MVVKVRQAMTVPHSAGGRSNGCKLASHLQAGKDLSEKLVTMDRSKCAMENGRYGKHETAVTSERTGSEGSQSSMESSTAGELGFSPSEVSSQSLFRKGRAGEDVTLDALAEDYVNRKSKRHPVGGIVHPHSAASLVDEDRGSTASEDGADTCTRVKFMCSFGGKIFPRPSDGKLRYVGGDTKIIAVNRDTNFHDLLAKMTEVYGENLILKYQLPGEDLDALVSVSSYEDLQNMMEEYDKLERADKSSRLRVFLFPAMENDSSVLKDSAGDLRNSEQRYVDAVNGISEAGSRIRMETYVSNAPVFPVDNLISIDGPEAWSMSRGQEPGPIPKVVHAHDVASHILRAPGGVAVSTVSSRPNTSSAPSSAPSSPPLLSRQTHGKLPVISDMHLPYHQETLAKLGAPFSLLTTEGNYSENESYVGSGASLATANQLEPHYRNSETRRGPDSPTRKQHESGHHDLHLRPDQRRFTEAKMPRVGSHGKLSRLAEHVEVVPTISETQQIPDTFERLFQQQQSLHQSVWPHSESSQESYRRPDLLQPGLLQQQGYQQQQPLLLRTGVQGVSSHDVAYRPDDQPHADEVLHHMPRSLSSHAIATASGQPSGYHVGSAPSSPRLGYPSRHVPSAQQIQPHWAFGGSALPEQPSYGRRKNYGDQWERSFRLSNSPPKYRDSLEFPDERLLRQQHALGNSEAAHHEQVSTSAHLGYDSNLGVAPYDLLSRPQVPLYKGQNVFQEKGLFQEHQDISDGRRHQLPQRIDNQYITGKQQHMHPTQNQRHEYHDPLLQMAEQVPGNLRYADTQLKVTDWDSDDSRLRGRSRVRTLEDDFHVDSGTPLQKEVLQGSFSSLHLPETSDELLSSSVGDLTPMQAMDHAGNSSFQFRPGMPMPGALPGYGGHMSRTNHVDSSAGPRYVTPRTSDSDYHVTRGFRAGSNIQDLRTSAFDVSGHQYTTGGLLQGMQLPSGHRVDERPPTTDNSFSAQLKNFRMTDNVNVGHDIRWNGGPDDIRIVDRPPGLPTPHMPRVASRLSRPSSSTNIPSLVEDLEEGVHIQPSVMQGRATNLMDDDPPHQFPSRGFTSSESIPFIVNAAKSANPPLKADPLPATSTDLFALEPTTGVVSSSEYLILKADLPSIKTTATQVPSVVDDDSGGTTSSTGGSSRSLSNRGSGEFSLEPMAMTQHLAEDMASCVLLEPSPTKVSSSVGTESEHVTVVQDQPKQPLDIAPGFSPIVWDHTPHSDEENHSELQFGKLSPKPRPTEEDELQPIANISSDSELEDARPELPRVVSSKNIVDTAAEEAREHGLQTIKNDDLEELRELGSGTFGTVYHGKWRGTDVAIKRIKASCFAGRPSEQERLIADFWREARNLGNLHHPNVVAFYGVVSDGPGGTLATVTEYMVNGSLKQVLQKKDRTIDRRKRHLIAMDAAFGMEYLHEKKVVHFDLKCENLLVNMRDPHRPVCKVGDLGLSKVKRQTMVSGGVRGTLPWMAPELLSNSSNLVTEKVDVFSFGIVMWELLTGEEPYANMHYGAIIGGIVNNTLRPVVPSWCDPRWRSLMDRCWASDPSSRPSFSEIASELRSMSESLRPKA